MEITFTVYKRIWYTAEEKERLKISASYFEIYFFNNLNILFRILFGTEDLLSLSEDIKEATSSMLLGVIKKELTFITMKVFSVIFIWETYFWKSFFPNWTKR